MSTTSNLTIDLLSQALAAQKIELKRDTADAFAIYADMLIDWNANRLNLTRLVTPEQIALGHFLDSLAVTQVVRIPYKSTLIDIGTGAGFPGLALKIFRPDLNLILVESTAKKLAFCQAVSEKIGLQKVEFIHGRAEDSAVSKKLAGSGDIVTARAVAQLKILLNWSSPLLSSSGVFVAWKGSRVYDEVQEAQRTAKYLDLNLRVAEQTLAIAGVEPLTHYFVVCRPNQ